jgi:hypothetical protein
MAAMVVPAVHALTPAEKAFVGEYQGGSVDTLAQLALLDDNTFCFAFMGGSLDLLAAGRWKAEGAGIRLLQVRPETPLFPAFARKVEAQGAMVAFDFHGHSLSDARAPVFAVSADDTPPSTLRPLFGEKHNSWAESYQLPPMPAGTVRYFYLGDLVEDSPGKAPAVKVVQYRLEGANSVRVGFDNLQAMPPMDQHGELRGDVLHLDGSRMGKRRPLAAEAAEQARTHCIQPALHPGAVRPSAEDIRNQPLPPAKTFTLKPSAIQGKPLFEAKGN